MNDLASLYPEHIATVRARFDAALAAAGYDRVVIAAGSLRYRFLDDRPYPFAANPHFKAWLPLTDHPDCFIVYEPGRTPLLYYHQPVDYWHKTPEPPAGCWVAHFDVRPIASRAAAVAQLPAHAVFLGEDVEALEDWQPAAVNPPALLHHLHYHRAWKTEYEVESIAAANRRAARGHQAAERAFRAGASEYAIHLEYCRACAHTEAELPYGNIVALNAHSAILHYQMRARISPITRLSCLIDAGAEVGGYAADITRTYAAAPGEFQDLIEALDQAQQALCAAVRPGVDFRDLQLAAHRHIAAILHDAGIVRLDPEAIVATGISRAFFPHGLGHFLGLQVHDVGGLLANPQGDIIPRPEDQPFLRLTRVLEPDMVLTIEPGLYIIPQLLAPLRQCGLNSHIDWAAVQRLAAYGGVRIEDDVVVTVDGHRNLTRPALAAA
ncbi:MAG TPA: Xaa-Pro dipeptidase [Candidatus Competibacteraceae bacterium]|nr:Xaa-Pro dipeptidase [Candidatus Competibacteraceae bacterium]